eukprot:jgi/Galph1/3185/GphlegSOOS_G1880.1
MTRQQAFKELYTGREHYLRQRKPPWLQCGTWKEILTKRSTKTVNVSEKHDQEPLIFSSILHEMPSQYSCLPTCHQMKNNFPPSRDKRCTRQPSEELDSSCSDKEIEELLDKYLIDNAPNNDVMGPKYEKRKESTSCRTENNTCQSTNWVQPEKSTQYNFTKLSSSKPVIHNQYSLPNSLNSEVNSESAPSTASTSEKKSSDVNNQEPGNPSIRTRKAPPFQRKKEKDEIKMDTSVRDKLLLEIQYGRQQLRSTPPRRQPLARPITARELLLEEIRQGITLNKISN